MTLYFSASLTELQCFAQEKIDDFCTPSFIPRMYYLRLTKVFEALLNLCFTGTINL
jgi:hypothetical protein